MPPVASIEERVLDLLVTTLGGIGTPPANWLTQPVVKEGSPFDAIPTHDVKPGDTSLQKRPRVWAVYLGTTPSDGTMGTATHRATLRFAAWCAAITMRGAMAARADVLRAVFAAEPAFVTAFKAFLLPGACVYRDDMAGRAGSFVVQQDLTIEVEVDHSSP